MLQKQKPQDDHAAPVLEKGSEHGQSSNTRSGGAKKPSSISIPLIPMKSAVAHTTSAAKKTSSQEASQRRTASIGAMDDPFAPESSTALDTLVAAPPVGRPLDSNGSAAGDSSFATFPLDGTSSQFAQFPQSQQPSLLSVFDDSGTVLQPTVLSAPLVPQPMGSMNPYASFGQPNGYHSSASVMPQQQGYSSASQGSITGMPLFPHTASIGSQYAGTTSHNNMSFFPATTQNAGLSAPPSIHAVVVAGATHSSSIVGVNYATQAPNQPIQALYPASQPISHINMSSDLSNKPNPPSVNPFDL